MTKHQEVYYTCNGCGQKLENDVFTDVVVNNTDETSNLPEQNYHLCALCWLKVYQIIDAVVIQAKADADAHNRLTGRYRDEEYDPWND